MMFLAFDCEGPITLNDNAFEFCKAIIPQGDLFFTKISRFDDYLAEIKRKKGYKAGDTLKLILPFLKLFGADNESLRKFSRKTFVFLPGALEFLKGFIDRPLYIVSTSYRPYLEALCEVSGFPIERVFCTEVDFSLVQISKAEREILEKLFKVEIKGEWVAVIQNIDNENRGVISLEDIIDLKLPPKQKAKLISKLTGENIKEIYNNLIH